MFSRVYIGVHYPFDVFTGAIIGVLVGFGCFSCLVGVVVARCR